MIESSQSERAFYEFWLPILSGLGQHCYHPIREIRQHSFSLLQKTLLSPELESYQRSSKDFWTNYFENVLFPLLDELLDSGPFVIDTTAIDEIRVRAFGLLCRVFLHLLPAFIQSKELLVTLWTKILDYLFVYLKTSKNDYLKEGIQESLKNMLLVLSTQNVFSKDDLESVNLWNLTWEKLDLVLPQLRNELFPSTV